MSTFSVPVKRIRAIEPHPNADAIELAVIDGYRSVVRKGELQAGDLVVYLPEAAVLPEWLLRRLNFWDVEKGKGTLNGKKGDRIRAVRLRGEMSQGVCYPVIQDSGTTGQIITGEDPGCFANVRDGDNVAELLGIVKYEPPIPVCMAGEIFNAGQRITLNFDIENWQSFPDVLQDGEEVVFTEKLHGTFTGVAVLPLADAHPEAFGQQKNILVFSKGMGAKGLVLKNNDANAHNLYVRATAGLRAAIDDWLSEYRDGLDVPHFFLGETFGPGVQDLVYGDTLGFRMFAAAKGYRGEQRYMDWPEVERVADLFTVDTVPVLYRGPFSLGVMREHAKGSTTLDATHIREGIVMTPIRERYEGSVGRVSLKSISAEYLARKNGTEYQ